MEGRVKVQYFFLNELIKVNCTNAYIKGKEFINNESKLRLDKVFLYVQHAAGYAHRSLFYY